MDRNATLDILQRAVKSLEAKTAAEKVFARYIFEQDQAMEELKLQLAVAERDSADKAKALKLVHRVKDMYAEHIKKQREVITRLESQISVEPTGVRHPVPTVLPMLGKSVSDTTVDTTPVQPRRRRRTCADPSYPSSVLDFRRTRHSRSTSMRGSVVQV